MIGHASAPLPPPPALHGRTVSYDPMRGEWLVLDRQPVVAGMPVWVVVAAAERRAEAERLAGLHDAPVRCWLLNDRERGWRRGPNTWVQDVNLASQMRAEEAQRLHDANYPRLELFVLRADGRVTCPDIVP